VMPRGSALLRPGRVTVEVGEAIATAGLGVEDRDALLASVRGAVAAMLPLEGAADVSKERASG